MQKERQLLSYEKHAQSLDAKYCDNDKNFTFSTQHKDSVAC